MWAHRLPGVRLQRNEPDLDRVARRTSPRSGSLHVRPLLAPHPAALASTLRPTVQPLTAALHLAVDGTKADEIALALEEAIVSGELAPGSVLRQEQVSAQYAVSRTPVREALRRLAALGLVSFEANRGFRVRTLSRAEMWEAFLLRAELESLITGVAAEKITDADLDELEAAERSFSQLTRALRAREPGEDRRSLTVDWMSANHGFHDVIYRVADLPYIEQIAKSARRTFAGPAVWAPGDESIDELYLANERQHLAIHAALAARSPDGARSLAREHVLASFRLLETILEQVGRALTDPFPASRSRAS